MAFMASVLGSYWDIFLILHIGIHIEEEAEEEEVDTSLRGRLLSLVDKIKSLRKKNEEEKPDVDEEPKPSKKKKENVKEFSLLAS